MVTRRCALAILVAAALGATACTKVYYPEGSSPTAPTPTPPQTPTPVKPDTIEFRVQGSNLTPGTPVIIRHTDGVNGLSLYNGGVPYFASISSTDETVFLYIEASTLGTQVTSTLQVQIYVNGRLFREAFSQGFTLNAQASGTYRR